MTPTQMMRFGLWTVVAFVILMVLVEVGWTQPVDDAWNTVMVDAELSWLVWVAEVFAFVGAFPVPLFVLVFGALVLWSREQRWMASTWIVIMAIAQILSIGIKELVGRARPLNALAYEPSASFPSGHSLVSGAAMAIGLALAAGVVWPHRHRIFLWIAGGYTILMAMSRTYLRVHWLSDVVGGVLLGTAVALVVCSVASHRKNAHMRADQRE